MVPKYAKFLEIRLLKKWGFVEKKSCFVHHFSVNSTKPVIGPCHVSGIFLPLRVKSLPLATIYEVKIPLRKWKKSLLQRNPAQMTSANVKLTQIVH
jgi:hypothetical protein